MNKMEPTTHSSARLPLPQPVCLLLYSCLLLPFFSHIADMPGLACLNRLSTEVKSKSNLVCDCTTAVLRPAKESIVSFRRARYGVGVGMTTSVCAVGNKVTHGVFCSKVPDRVSLCYVFSANGVHAACVFYVWRCLLFLFSHFNLRNYCLWHPWVWIFSSW